MALRNPKVFGLNVLTSLADVLDKEQSLNSLNLSSRDLNIIRGSQNVGATSGDWISLSRLTNPIYRILDRNRFESNSYLGILDVKAGIERTLFGNLSINGILSGNAVRYRYVDGTGVGATVNRAVGTNDGGAIILPTGGAVNGIDKRLRSCSTPRF